VRVAQVPYAIVRPSIIIGDSQTGYIKAFQGIHLVAAAVVDGFVPVAPFDASWLLDFVPSDIVAGAIATVMSHQLTGEFWVTAGPNALPLSAVMGASETLGEELGIVVNPVRFVPPEVFDRLFAPVFLDALPRRAKYTILKLLEFFAAYLAIDEPLPSDLDRLCALAGNPLPDLRSSLMTSMRYWAAATNRAPAFAATVA
jgi:Male sterility protein